MRVKSFPLDNYFLYFKESLLDEGETLKAGGHLVVKQRDASTGYWSLECRNPAMLEIEVVTKRRQVKSYSCDCETFSQKQLCGHLAGALKYILDELDKEEADRAAKQASQAAGRLNISSLINQLGDDELRSFIAGYARHHRDFALLLKAKFAWKVELKDNLSKYYDLLRSYSKALGSKPLGKTATKKLGIYIDNLLGLADDLMSEAEYREAFALLHGTIRYVGLQVPPGHLVEELRQAHVKTDFLLDMDLAPSFRQEMLLAFLAIAEERRYTLDNWQLNLHAILYPHFGTDGKQQVIDDLRLRWQASKLPGAALTLMSLLLSDQNDDEVTHLLLSARQNHELIRTALTLLAKADRFDLSAAIAETLYQDSRGRRLRQICLQHLTSDWATREDKIRWLRSHFISSGERGSFAHLQELQIADWDAMTAEMIGTLEARQDWTLLAFVLGETKRLEALWQLLEERGDLALILDHLGYLRDIEDDRLLPTIYAHIQSYLHRYVGRKSVDHVLQALTRIERHRRTALSQSLRDQVFRDFRERTFLIKALRHRGDYHSTSVSR